MAELRYRNVLHARIGYKSGVVTMHAINCFLLEIEQDDIAADAKGQLENWMNRHGDENNWYIEDLLCLRNGQVLGMEDGIWKTNEWLIKKLDGKADTAFDWARRFALDCVCLDMGLAGPSLALITPTEDEKSAAQRLNEMSFDDVLQHIADTVPKRLSKMYAELKAGQPGMDNYRRRSLVREFELYWDACNKPFATTGTPYEYRAFDLTDGYAPSEHAAILLVNVHT